MTTPLAVCSFYRFAAISEPVALRAPLLEAALARNLLGTILLAEEGINGTLAGTREAIQSLFDWLTANTELKHLAGRWSDSAGAPFQKTRVRLRREIVSLGRPDVNPADGTGRHVTATEWNRLLERDDVIVIDTRNDYEIEVGTFPGIENPATQRFREFPEYVAKHRERLTRQPVAMFCTGGIRCEKAAALLLAEGCPEVYQLEGGILGYLDSVAAEHNRWQGECFVFDNRVALDRDLSPGDYVQCHACRRPLGPAELASPLYEPGLSCPHCHGTIAPDRLDRLRQRRYQNELARRRARANTSESA